MERGRGWAFFFYEIKGIGRNIITLTLHPFASRTQEIDKVHSLTLGKIIRLNTGFKSAPDNVLFSMDYCVGVKDFQCIPHNKTLTGHCDNMEQRLQILQEDFERQKKACHAESSVTDASVSNDISHTVLIVMCVTFFLIAALFFTLFLRSWILLRRNLRAALEKEIGSELRVNFEEESEFHQNNTAI